MGLSSSIIRLNDGSGDVGTDLSPDRNVKKRLFDTVWNSVKVGQTSPTCV